MCTTENQKMNLRTGRRLVTYPTLVGNCQLPLLKFMGSLLISDEDEPLSIQEFRVEPESPESGPEPIVYDRSYGWEPEDMV